MMTTKPPASAEPVNQRAAAGVHQAIGGEEGDLQA
jgi:hypothetical protein